MKQIPIGKDDFQKLIEDNCYYVDKTKAIEDILFSGTDVYLFTRPRRFGKNLFISMLSNFLDIEKKERNKNLFDNLYINKTKYMNSLSKYPVIDIDFKNLKCESYEELYENFKYALSQLYESKLYLVENLDSVNKEMFMRIYNRTATITDYSFTDYSFSLMYLSNWLYKYYGEKTIILIDEYDTPIQESYMNGFYEEAIKLIKPMLSACLKGNDSYIKEYLLGY